MENATSASKMEKRLDYLVSLADERTAKSLIGKEDFAQKLMRKNSKLQEFWDDVCDSFKLIAKIFSGEFKDYAWTDLMWIVGGLGYLILPIDAIPDPIPFWGLTDDTGALGIAFARSGKILPSFRVFMGRGVVEKVFDNVGLMDSLSAAFRRVALKCEAKVEPLPGTPLVVSLAHAVEHSGVYMGSGEVMEVFDGDEGGEIRIVPLRRFLCGEGFPRVGKYIYAPCAKDASGNFFPLSSQEAVANALKLIKDNEKVAYNMLKSNCHMFTASCLLGRQLFLNRAGRESHLKRITKNTASLCAAALRGSFTIKRLTAIVEKVLNDGKKVGWCRVPGWNRKEFEED